MDLIIASNIDEIEQFDTDELRPDYIYFLFFDYDKETAIGLGTLTPVSNSKAYFIPRYINEDKYSAFLKALKFKKMPELYELIRKLPTLDDFIDSFKKFHTDFSVIVEEYEVDFDIPLVHNINLSNAENFSCERPLKNLEKFIKMIEK